MTCRVDASAGVALVGWWLAWGGTHRAAGVVLVPLGAVDSWRDHLEDVLRRLGDQGGGTTHGRNLNLGRSTGGAQWQVCVWGSAWSSSRETPRTWHVFWSQSLHTSVWYLRVRNIESS